MLGTAEKVRINSEVTFSYGFLYMDMPVLADQQGFTYISSAQTQDAV